MAEKMTLTDTEIKWLLTSPDALRAVANYNDWQESQADSMGMPCSVHRERRIAFHAEAKRIEAEWDAEREPEQRVFLPDAHLTQPAQAVDARAVLTEMRAAADNNGATMGQCFEWWRKLTRALGNAQAEGWRVPEAVRKGFMTSESCGHDKRYVLSIKFRSLEDLQAAHHAMLGLSPTPPQPEE